MFKKILLILVCLFASPICFAAKTIVVLGDSLSAGYGIDIQQGWVALLQNRLQHSGYSYQVANASISGDTTSEGLARLPGAIQRYNPQIVIVELGGNDALRGIQLQTTHNNLGQIILLAQKARAKVLLLGIRLPPNYGPVYTQQFQAIYVQLAKKYHIAVVPLFLNGVDANPQLMQDDGIHPRAAGQPIMLNNVWGKLKQMLK